MQTLLTPALIGLFVFSGSTSPALLPQAEVTALVKPVQTYSVAMTGYNAVPEQTDSDPYTTASGAYSDPDIIAARSADLAEELPFGTIIEITPREQTRSGTCGFSAAEPFIGLRVVADSMHSRKRNQIDLLFDADASAKVGKKNVNPALALGVCKGVEIRVVGYVAIENIPRSQAELKRVVGEQRLTI